MAALVALGSEQIRHSACEHIEIDAAVIMIKEEGVVECSRFARQTQILIVMKHAVHDEVSENRLFLLPPSLAVMPYKSVMLAIRFQLTFNHVVPPSPLAVRSCIRHELSNLAGESDVGILGFQRLHAHQVPGNLQIV